MDGAHSRPRRARDDGAHSRPRREQDELDRWEVYLTPGPVAEQGLLAARELLGAQPDVLVDVGAGPGVFGQRAALVFPAARRLGLEVRDEPRSARHYHDFARVDFREPTVRRLLQKTRPGLLISNPPFTGILDVLQLGHEVVRPGGLVVLLARSTFGGSEADEAELRRRPPVLELAVPGRLRLRRGISPRTGRPYGTDRVGHVFLFWRVGSDRPGALWARGLLPALPSASLGWTERPGDEAYVQALAPEFWPRRSTMSRRPQTTDSGQAEARRSRRAACPR